MKKYKVLLAAVALSLAAALTGCGSDEDTNSVQPYTEDTQVITSPTDNSHMDGMTFSGRFRADMDDAADMDDFEAYLEFNGDGTFAVLMSGELAELGLTDPISFAIHGNYEIFGNEISLMISQANVRNFLNEFIDDLLDVFVYAILEDELGADFADDPEFEEMVMLMDLMVRGMLEDLGEELADEFIDMYLTISDDFNRLYDEAEGFVFVRV